MLAGRGPEIRKLTEAFHSTMAEFRLYGGRFERLPTQNDIEPEFISKKT